MKAITFLILLLLLNFQTIVIANGELPRSVVFKQRAEEEKPKVKAIPGMRQKNIGIGLTAAGLGLIAIEGILMATSNWQKVTTSYGTTYGTRDMKGAIGQLLIVPGIGLTIPGGLVWGAGKRKIKRYRKNLLENKDKIIAPKPIAPDAIPIQERY